MTRSYQARLCALGLFAAMSAAAGDVSAQDAVRVQPRSYRVVLENADVRVLEYDSLPGMGVCGTGRHYHPRHLTVLLTPARVRVTAGGKTFIAVSKAGDAFWSPAEWHEAENVSGNGVRSLIIEMKRPEPK